MEKGNQDRVKNAIMQSNKFEARIEACEMRLEELEEEEEEE